MSVSTVSGKKRRKKSVIKFKKILFFEKGEYRLKQKNSIEESTMIENERRQ